MAAIDSLLRLITSQSAEALSLSTDQVPRLTRKGEKVPLSMPPLGAALMETFVGELLSSEQRQEVGRRGELTLEHGEFTVTVKRQGEGWSIGARPRPVGSSAAAASPAGPARVAAPSPPPPAAAASASLAAPAATSSGELAAPDAARRRLRVWLERLLEEQGSDLLVSWNGARIRVAAGLQVISGEPLGDEALLALLWPAASPAQRQAFEQHGAADLALSWPLADGEARFRVNLFRHHGGLAASIRPVRRLVTSLEELRLPSSLTRLVGYPHGMVLLTGPAGSGKSTTLTALVEHLNRSSEKHIITIEDPIEHEYPAGRCLIHQREVGTDVDSFEAGLRAALREAPDVILLGEMRDRATIAAALTAAETGHLVLSTLHAAHPAMAVERVIDVFPEHQQAQARLQLAQTLRGVLAQHLLPSTIKGQRVPALELLVVTSAVAAIIREGRTHQLTSAIQTGRDEGMIPLERSLGDHITAGALSFEVAASITADGGVQLRELVGRGRR